MCTFYVETTILSFSWILNQYNECVHTYSRFQKMTIARQLKSLNPLIIFTLGTMLVVLIRCLLYKGSRSSEDNLTFASDRIQKLEEGMGGEEKGKMRKEKEEVKSIERSSSLIQDMSDPFEDFPHTQPFDCINITQRFFNLFSNYVSCSHCIYGHSSS